MTKVRSAADNCKHWIRRYGPIEVVGTIFAVSVGLVVYGLAGRAACAFAAAWAETVGYYGAAVLFELNRKKAARAVSSRSSRGRRLVSAVGTVVVEFGPAELLDTVFVRPGLMYLAPTLTGTLWSGLLVGKLAADVMFYALVVPTYELRKRLQGDRSSFGRSDV